MKKNRYKKMFFSESKDYLQNLIKNFLRFQKRPKDKKLINKLMLLTHNFRGVSFLMNFKELANLLKAQENILDKIRLRKLKWEPEISKVFKKSFKRIKKSLNLIRKDEKELKTGDLIKDFYNLIRPKPKKIKKQKRKRGKIELIKSIEIEPKIFESLAPIQRAFNHFFKKIKLLNGKINIKFQDNKEAKLTLVFPIKFTYKFEEEKINKFKKLLEICSKEASESLSVLTRKKIEIKNLNVSIFPVQKISEVFAESIGLGATVILNISNDINGKVLVVSSRKDALLLADLLLSRPLGISKVFDRLDQSALKEMGSILCGSFLACLSDSLDLDIVESSPDLFIGMTKTAIDKAILDFKKEDFIFVVDFKLFSKDRIIDVIFLFLIDLKSATKMLKAIK